MTDQVLSIPEHAREICNRRFDESEVKQDVTKPDGFKPRYIESTSVLKRLDEAFGGGWSFHVRDVHWIGTQQVLVEGELSVQAVHEVNGQQYTQTVTKGHFGSCDIRVFSGGRQDPASDVKAAATDCIKKCATLFGVGQHLYTDDEAPFQGGYTGDVEQMQRQNDRAHNDDDPAEQFQVQAVCEFFTRAGINEANWCQNLQIAAPQAMTKGMAQEVLSGTHPYVQWLLQNGYIQQAPTGLKASNA